MSNLYNLMSECIRSLDEIYDLILNEDINNIGIKYTLLSENINALYIMILGDERLSAIMKLMERLYTALEKGDFIKALDITGFEMKPIFTNYLEGIGE